MNLLPNWVQAKKKRRSFLLLLATVQVAIFFVLGMVVLMVSLAEQRVWDRSAELDLRLAGFASAPAETAVQLQQARREAVYFNEFITLHAGEQQSFDWLREVLNTVPSHGNQF